jgi:hypothetical protein
MRRLKRPAGLLRAWKEHPGLAMTKPAHEMGCGWLEKTAEVQASIDELLKRLAGICRLISNKSFDQTPRIVR